jgi:O-antigen biosynthesis protein
VHRPRADIAGEAADPVATAVLRTAFSRAGERRFFGFVFDPTNLSHRFTVEIMVDGYPIKVLRADSYVHELATEQVGDGCYGFSVSLHDSLAEECAIIEARLANLGTPVGAPIALNRVSDQAHGPHGPGALRWLGGVRFSGWISARDESATANVLVDGTLVTQVRGTIWTHVGTAEEGALPVRGFDLHLPRKFADGGVHQLALVTEDGEHLAGSPLTFLAFADGFREALAGFGVVGREQARAELLDRFVPMSVPFSHYHAWRENFSIEPDPSAALRGAVIMVGPGDMDETLDSLHQQNFVDWIAASLPPTSDPTGFQRETALAFLETDGAQCDFVVFGLAGTLLVPVAVDRIASAFSQFKTAAAVYGDLDLQTSDGSVWPLCFPAFDYERMLEQGYCAQLFALQRMTAIRALQADAESLYRVFNAVFDDGTVSFRDVVHLPGALGTLPAFDREAASAALVDASRTHARRRGIHAQLRPGSGGTLPAARIVRTFERARTTIVIPTRNRPALLENCIESIRPAVKRQNAEIMVVDNDSTDLETLDYLAGIDGDIATVLRVPGDFNFPRVNNRAAQAASGDILCLLNNSIKALDDAWLDELLGRITAEDVGAVGALLLWPSGVVQHGGVVLGPGFAATHAFDDRLTTDVGYGDLLRVAHECSAVTAACLVTRRRDYLDVGGMDEALFPVNFNDVDYCLKLRARGKRIVFTPHAKLMHQGSTSRGPDKSAGGKPQFERELDNLRTRWGKVLASDPYYSPMLSLDSRPFSALAWPVRALSPRVNEPPRPVEMPPGF